MRWLPSHIYIRDKSALREDNIPRANAMAEKTALFFVLCGAIILKIYPSLLSVCSRYNVHLEPIQNRKKAVNPPAPIP